MCNDKQQYNMDNKEHIIQRIEQSLQSIRPHLQSDGGDIEIAELTDQNVLKVRLLGSCQQCPMSFMTMKTGIELSVRAAVPEIIAVEAIDNN